MVSTMTLMRQGHGQRLVQRERERSAAPDVEGPPRLSKGRVTLPSSLTSREKSQIMSAMPPWPCRDDGTRVRIKDPDRAAHVPH